MKQFENLTFKQVKKEILYWEQDNENPKSVIVVSIGQSPVEDGGSFVSDDGTEREVFYANVLIDGEPHSKGYVWDCDEEDIISSFDRDEDDDDDDELPENVVERCDYVGLTMGQPVCFNDIELDLYAELKVPVTHVRWNYPFEVKEGSYNVYPIEEAHTWFDLLSRISEVFEDEYNEHESEMGHVIGDYIIELLEIHPNGLATVSFGS